MAKTKYEINFYISNISGSSKSGPHTKIFEEESEANAINAAKKHVRESASRIFQLISLKKK